MCSFGFARNCHKNVFHLQDNYDAEFIKTVYQSAVVSYQELKQNAIAYDGPVRIIYHTKDIYKRTAKMLGLMDDFKVSKLDLDTTYLVHVATFIINSSSYNITCFQSGVPRMGYRGVVTFHYNGRTVFLAPNMNWKGYDLTWS